MIRIRPAHWALAALLPAASVAGALHLCHLTPHHGCYSERGHDAIQRRAWSEQEDEIIERGARVLAHAEPARPSDTPATESALPFIWHWIHVDGQAPSALDRHLARTLSPIRLVERSTPSRLHYGQPMPELVGENAESGEQVWSFWPREAWRDTGARRPIQRHIASDGNRVLASYVTQSRANIYGIDGSLGALMWRHEIALPTPAGDAACHDAVQSRLEGGHLSVFVRRTCEYDHDPCPTAYRYARRLDVASGEVLASQDAVEANLCPVARSTARAERTSVIRSRGEDGWAMRLAGDRLIHVSGALGVRFYASYSDTRPDLTLAAVDVRRGDMTWGARADLITPWIASCPDLQYDLDYAADRHRVRLSMWCDGSLAMLHEYDARSGKLTSRERF